MRIIQSFFPNSGMNIDLDIYLYLTKLSVDSILKFYDGVELYTTQNIKDLIEENNIPYTNINTKLFNNFESMENYAIPKIITYIEQTKPYIHIDYDVIINKKIEFDEEICFGHMDYNGQNNKFKDEYYLKSYWMIENFLPQQINENVDVNFIPNFCVFGTNNCDSVKFTFKKILEFYKNNHVVMKNLNYIASLTEQFLFLPFYKSFYKLEDKNIKIISEHPMLAQYISWYNDRDIDLPFIHFTNVKNNNHIKSILKINN
jgi:hypothetical protein